MTAGRRPVPTDAAARPPVPPALVLGVAIAGISWAAILVRWSAASAHALAFWRLTLSLLVVAGALTLRREWRAALRVRPRDLVWTGAAGLLLAAHFVAWFVSLEWTTVASSTLLVNLQPLFAAGLSAVWLRERPRPVEWAGIVLAVGGAAVVSGAGFRAGGPAMAGNLLALVAGAFAAAYYVIGRKLRPGLGLWPYVAQVYAIAAVVLAPVLAVRGDPWIAYPAREWWIFAGLAAGPMLLGHTGLNWALRYVRAYIVNLTVLGEPIGATLLAWWLLGGAEAPGAATAAGGSLILLGLALSIYSRREGV